MKAVLLFSLLIICFCAHALGRRSRKLPEFHYDCSKVPTICENTRQAIDAGMTQYLSRSGSGISRNRYAACGGAGAPSGLSCDEYPFASTRQGGKGAKISYVPKRENYSQGGQLSAFYRKNGISKYGRNSNFYMAYPKL